MTATIKDVAARAGVSTKTVSRVMNGEAHVRDMVREIVMRAVAELGYRPNAFARSLSSARSYLIGLFFDDPASGYAVSMQRGALARCRESHYHLVVERLDCTSDGWREELTSSITALQFDGVILTPPLSQSTALLNMLEGANVPHVCISPGPAIGSRYRVVDFDETLAAFDMTTRLIALGHRDVGFIEGDPTHASTQARRSGFIDAMAAAGLPIMEGRIRPGDFTFRSGLVAAEALIADGACPSAIFASNDDMALGVCVAALKHGLEVPGRLSVAGFDDAPSSRMAWPPITTVRQPVQEMGAVAVGMLIEPNTKTNSIAGPRSTRLAYSLIERGSTAPVPNSGELPFNKGQDTIGAGRRR